MLLPASEAHLPHYERCGQTPYPIPARRRHERSSERACRLPGRHAPRGLGGRSCGIDEKKIVLEIIQAPIVTGLWRNQAGNRV